MKNFSRSSSAEKKRRLQNTTANRRSLTVEAQVRSQVHVGFVVYKLALGQVCLPVRPSSLVNIIPPMFYTRHPHAALTRRINGRSLGTSPPQKKKFSIANRKSPNTEVLSPFPAFKGLIYQFNSTC
jgi:hypothetical protein